MSKRNLFTDEEDAMILSYIKHAEDEGLPLSPFYMIVADKLGRPISSVTNRGVRLKKQMKDLSDTEMLILKLKAIGNEKERSTETVDLYKSKFTALKGEHDNLREKYDKLLVEHNNLVNTVKQIVGYTASKDNTENEETDQ